MAVGAAAVEKTALVCRILAPVAGMTFVAKPGHAHLEQTVIDGAVRLVAIGAIIRNRRMLMEKRPAPLGVAGVTVLVDAGLLELRRIGRAMRVMTIGASDLSFPHGHMRRAQQLRFPLQMAGAAKFSLRPLVEERGIFIDLGQLIAVSGFFHDGVTVDAGDTPARVRAGIPISLNAALVASQARLVLPFHRLTGVLAKGEHAADTFAAPGSDVIAARTVAIFTSLFLGLVARVEKKDFSHLRLGEFFVLGSMAGFTNFVAGIGRGASLSDLLLRRQRHLRKAEQHQTRYQKENASPHNFPISRAEKIDSNFA